MKFFGTYGCSMTNSIYNIAIEARDAQSALKFYYRGNVSSGRELY